MIRKTLEQTKLATYAVDLPEPRMAHMPAPCGTGFFVSADGWFVTAAHVVTENGQSDGPIRTDIGQGWLEKESPPGDFCLGMCTGLGLDFVDQATDFALLKINWAENAGKDHLKDRDGFPFIEVSSRELKEGDPVYAFGYPLPESELLVRTPQLSAGHVALCPRVTSAIVASQMDRSMMVSSNAEPRVYVLDKALNYENSGGPIVAAETGHVHAICRRFQPVVIPQRHIVVSGKPLPILIPSLYGVVSSLGDPRILTELRSRNIPIAEV